MGGIYIHIPFCHQACHYCDFHFSTQLGYVDQMVDAICEEIHLKRTQKGPDSLHTIYFGGGTPSLLTTSQLNRILNVIVKNYEVASGVEVTLEANPEDIAQEKVREWIASGINRLSIGIQTFDDQRLVFLNRNHDSRSAHRCVEIARDTGINNLTIDLIYAIPPDEMDYWKKDIETAVDLNIPHLSVYGLTIEEKTVFGNWYRKNKLDPVSESTNEKQYLYAESTLQSAGYLHYEVSNYAKQDQYSKHNSNYWLQKAYIGIGPGAHSYDGATRACNISNNHLYMQSISSGKIPEEVEELNPIQKLNEYILTRSRTIYGLDFVEIKEFFGVSIAEDRKEWIQYLTKNKLAIIDGKVLRLTSAGMKLADEITLKLFYNE